jgi:hypothetical protein
MTDPFSPKALYEAGQRLYGRGAPRPTDKHMAKGWDEARAYYLAHVEKGMRRG